MDAVATAASIERLSIIGLLALIIIVGGGLLLSGKLITSRHIEDVRAAHAEELKALKELYDHDATLLASICEQRLHRAETAEQMLRDNIKDVFAATGNLAEMKELLKDIATTLSSQPRRATTR